MNLSHYSKLRGCLKPYWWEVCSADGVKRAASPTDLTGAQQALIEPYLPPISPSTQGETIPRRERVNAIRSVLRTGIQWRMMLHDLPHWNTVQHDHLLWSKTGRWEQVNAALVKQDRERKRRRAEPSAVIAGCQSVKTIQKKGLAAPTATKN